MFTKKKIFIGLVIMALGFLFYGSQRQEKHNVVLSLNSARLVSGENLVKTNILSDPSVLDTSITEIQNCEIKFPKIFNYSENNSIYPESSLDMWFTSYTNKQLVISYAKSSNGLIWEQVSEGVLNPKGWDKIGVETAKVIKVPNGKYFMYYSSSLTNHDDFVIGLATSVDGKNWIKQGDGPVFTPKNSWELAKPNGVNEPSVIYDSQEKIFKMWYSALGEKEKKLTYRIGYATSQDGINWARREEPVLDVGLKGTWDNVLVSHGDVIKTKQGYHMFYFGVKDWCDDCSMQRGSIGHAFSKDGLSWEKNPNNPILSPKEGNWDAWSVGGPSAIVKNNKLWLWYFGNRTKDSYEGKIGLVYADCNEK